MSSKKIFEDINFNFQVNRVLSFGYVACNREEIYKAATKINDFDTWYKELFLYKSSRNSRGNNVKQHIYKKSTYEVNH